MYVLNFLLESLKLHVRHNWFNERFLRKLYFEIGMSCDCFASLGDIKPVQKVVLLCCPFMPLCVRHQCIPTLLAG